jgi:hypothetical protein
MAQGPSATPWPLAPPTRHPTHACGAVDPTITPTLARGTSTSTRAPHRDSPCTRDPRCTCARGHAALQKRKEKTAYRFFGAAADFTEGDRRLCARTQLGQQGHQLILKVHCRWLRANTEHHTGSRRLRRPSHGQDGRIGNGHGIGGARMQTRGRDDSRGGRRSGLGSWRHGAETGRQVCAVCATDNGGWTCVHEADILGWRGRRS